MKVARKLLKLSTFPSSSNFFISFLSIFLFIELEKNVQNIKRKKTINLENLSCQIIIASPREVVFNPLSSCRSFSSPASFLFFLSFFFFFFSSSSEGPSREKIKEDGSFNSSPGWVIISSDALNCVCNYQLSKKKFHLKKKGISLKNLLTKIGNYIFFEV